MQCFAYVGAATFIALLGTANVMFALQLGTEVHERAWWIAAAVGSACWTVAGVGVFVSQLQARRWARTVAAGAVLGLALAYDILAAYGVSSQEQAAKGARLDMHAAQVADVRADVERIEARLAALPAVSPAQAEALIAAVTVTAEQCAQVTGPNRLTRRAADRVRAACARRAAALRAKADADTRTAQIAALGALRAKLRALQVEAPAPDPRLALLPAWAVAWLPVILITGGGLASGFALGRPAIPSRPDPEALDGGEAETVTPALSPPETLPPALHVAAERILRVAAQDVEPAGLKRDGAGFLRGTQRRLAEITREPVTRVNKALRLLASSGVIDLDAGPGGTGFRLSRA